MRIVVTGSLAYDYIMNFPGYFQEHILPEKAHVISVSFLVKSMQRLRGGVAGNVAYNLALLGEPPLVFSTIGQDFAEYATLLETYGIDTSGLVPIENEFTASCFITTDSADNQIVAFYPGAMASAATALSLHDLNLTSDDLVVLSASEPDSMERIALECQQLGVPYVFDPGKQSPRLTAEFLQIGLAGAQVLVGNDYEFAMMARILGISEAELITRAPMTVITRGEQGSTFYTSATNGQGITIPVVRVPTVEDPTGAGDAYLAGVVFGLVRKFPLEVTGRIAALTATYTLEKRGCQEHFFTIEDFVARYTAEFGENEYVSRLVTSREPLSTLLS
ncbi:MAG: carbohydrate kinase family protein [Chloroflexaceae bacterium]|nr:carbohydrate kinase family protein [Chloroflexaceae bacterium]NJO06002.1 carbohydrate kinase family protein [Chloroflexaceae bacterium]